MQDLDAFRVIYLPNMVIFPMQQSPWRLEKITRQPRSFIEFCLTGYGICWKSTTTGRVGCMWGSASRSEIQLTEVQIPLAGVRLNSWLHNMRFHIWKLYPNMVIFPCGKFRHEPKKIARQLEGFIKFCLTGLFYTWKGDFLSDQNNPRVIGCPPIFWAPACHKVVVSKWSAP